MKVIFDIETNGLKLNDISILHCLSYHILDFGAIDPSRYDRKGTLFDKRDIADFLRCCSVLVGHNVILYDVPALEKLLNIKVEAKLVDTLALSWYLYPERFQHSLESFDHEFGLKKVQIEDWSSLTPEQYAERCAMDVELNTHLYTKQRKKLLRLYGTEGEIRRLEYYLSFKLLCVQQQSVDTWRVDLARCEQFIGQLSTEQDEKIRELRKVMPRRTLTTVKSPPAKPFKKDGSWSTHGENWFNLLKERGLPNSHTDPIVVETGDEEGNPNSPEQVKDWLFSLGWDPCTYKYVKEAGGERKVPQIRNDGKKGGGLTASVLSLAETHPDLLVLDGLSVIQHRLSVFKGFVKNEENGRLTANISGFTNTLRFKHKEPLVNLPGVDKPWGEEIRGVLLASEGNVLCGSDMVSLEDMTKRHYMYDYDPKYVEEMSKEGFDPHLDLAKFAKACTEEEVEAFVNKIEGAKNLTSIRKQYKQANYSCVYGVGAPKLARELNTSLAEGTKLKDAYWERNWAVLEIAKNTKVVKFDGEMWLYNPVSRFYLSLRAMKDIFSTLNQSTGVYCFDRWISKWFFKIKHLTGQFHDEVIIDLPETKQTYVEKTLREAINLVNDELKLNIKLDIDIKFGDNYAEIH